MNKKLLIIPVFVGMGMVAFAQPGGPEAVKTITSAYDPKVANANKFEENPNITDSVPKATVLDYTTEKRQFKTGFDIDPIKAAVVKDGQLGKLQRLYAKVGFGNYTTPYGEIWLNSLRSKSYQMGLHYRHLSSMGKINDVGYPGYSTNEASLYGKKFINGKHTISGDLFYNRNARHYYGYDPTVFNLSKKNTLQYFNMGGINLVAESNYVGDSSRIHYRGDMNYYYLADRFRTTEQRFGMAGKAWFNSKVISYGGLLAFDYIQNRNGVDTINTYLVTINPIFKARGDRYMINAGAIAYLNVDTGAQYKLHPYVDAQFNIYENYLIVFAGVSGRYQRNTFLDLTTTNPFMNTNAPIRNSNHKIQLFGGLKGALSSNTSFKLDVMRETVDNMVLFVNDTVTGPRNTFFIAYDTVRVFNVNGEFVYAKAEKFSVGLRGEYYNYKPRNEEKAWHMPNFKVTLNTRYNIADKIIARLDVFVVGTRYARDLNTDTLTMATKPFVATKLKPYVDINLGLEYRYNKTFSAFVNVNNLAARRYERWNNFPSQRINFILGIAYSM